MNAFRQGRGLGTHLIVGVNSDESITVCKGAPVMGDAERMMTVKGCRWVDEVVTDVPYVMNQEYIDYIIDKYQIDYVVHGDDPCIVSMLRCLSHGQYMLYILYYALYTTAYTIYYTSYSIYTVYDMHYIGGW